jgi:hypothetical protein
MTTARERYNKLSSNRYQFLDTAVECSKLTLPYLISREDESQNHRVLVTPWQSVGSKAVVTLAAKLMLALLPPQTTFFKLQVKEDKLGENVTPEIKSELDLSFSKMERTIMESIAASNDRVVVHQALKHLIVGGNALIFMGKEGLKHYPLNRYVVNRDGNGEVLEIITKESVSKELLNMKNFEPQPNRVQDEGSEHTDEVDIYTHVKLDNGRWRWHQECLGKVMDGTKGTAPKNASPWLVLRFNTCDGEDYGRGRVEEFLGDFRSLEALSQALVEGSAAAAKVVFLVSPSSTTKPQTLAQAGNGAIIQGRQEDVTVVTTGGKTADFATAANLAQQLERRIGEAFLQLNIRQSERTTAEEVRLTQLELEQQLGGLFSLLTVEFLVPYLNRVMMVLQRNGQLPKIPKEYVSPTIVAGVNALGRGQDRESLTTFITTIAQTLGPEALMKYIDSTEAIKRLAAAQGIDYLGLVKREEQVQQEMQQQQQMAQQQSLVDQAGQLASAPMMDPSKQPQEQQQQQPPQDA